MIRRFKWYICIALLAIAVWNVYTNGITKYMETLTFFNIQSEKEAEFSNNGEKGHFIKCTFNSAVTRVR